MSQERNMKWLNNNRIIYRRNPITDVPTESTDLYDYYAEGTFECYSLFRSKAKITTYKSLKWHLLVIHYLNYDGNPHPYQWFSKVARFIADKENGFVTFYIKWKILEQMILDVILQGDTPPRNRIRKVIFKEKARLLTLSEKLSIVGKLIGKSKRITQEDIYECMIDLNSNNKKITISKLADMLKCTTRTIHRNMGNQLKAEKEYLNKEYEKIQYS